MPGGIMGVLALIGWVSQATGHPALGAVFNDPNFANAATAVVSGVATIAAGLMKGIEQHK